LAWHAFIGLADQGKDNVFRFIIEYSSSYGVGLFLKDVDMTTIGYG
jgi:hypothetical protein